ncbi:MAG: hypothetical protein MI976_02050 [Pseudomonadales bacterium]|nr:hypothetical protein [Pseudomonadales bacterium]
MKNRVIFVIPLLFGFMLSGCAMFTSHYDATRHENFTKLKAVHLKLYDNWTEGSSMSWEQSAVSEYCENGDLTFREAFEFAKSKDNKDQTGQKAVKFLWEEFKDNCESSLSMRKLFSKVFMDELRPQVEKNYDYAIQGELSRVNAPE